LKKCGGEQLSSDPEPGPCLRALFHESWIKMKNTAQSYRVVCIQKNIFFQQQKTSQFGGQIPFW
jgi:hypothetical protein